MSRVVSPWRRARPEIVIAAILVAAFAAAGLVLAGWPGLAVVGTVAAALILLALRGLAPRPAPESARQAQESDAAAMRSIRGYSQRRFVVASGIRSRAFYEADLRPALEHLLAARLAERHGLNLNTDRDAAKRAFVRTRADEALWRWIDPAASRASTGESREGDSGGIPRRALAQIIDRLEQM